MSEFRCDLNIPKTSLQTDEVLTVGREFTMKCHGEWPENFSIEKAQFKLEKNDKYLLKILKSEKTSNSEFQFLVTSYIPGKIEIPNLILSDGSTLIDLGKVAFQVESVVVQENAQNAPPEPYGPMGPFGVSFPWILLNYVALVLIFMAFALSFRIYLKIKRRKLLKQMEIYESASSAPVHYYQNFRKIQREIGRLEAPEKVVLEQDKIKILEDIKLAWNIYLYQRFKIPTLYLSSPKVLNEIKSESLELAQQLRQSFKNFDRELKSAQQNLVRMKSSDLLQLLQSTQKMMDAVEKFDSQEKKMKQKRKGL